MCKLNKFSSEIGQILAGVIIFLFIAVSAAITMANFISQRFITESKDIREKITTNLAEAGLNYAIFKLNSDTFWSGIGETSFGNGSFEVIVASIDSNTKTLTSIGYIPNKANYTAKTTIRSQANLGEGLSFRYAVQAGDLGVQLDNNSIIRGNLYSNGNVTGSSGAQATGTVIVAATSTISGITIGGDAYAKGLFNCTIQGSAYYATISSCTVNGQQFPNSSEQPKGEYPISNDQIESWKNDALNGGSQGGINLNGSQILSVGPKKITGNVSIQDNAQLTITGTLHITGTLSVKNNAIVKLSPLYGSLSGIVVVDGKVSIENNAQINGSGTGESTILIVGLSATAIDDVDLENNAVTGTFFAPNGEISIENNVELESAIAKKLHLKNNAEVIYKTGLASQNFSSGPSASWRIKPGTWRIIR